MDNQYKYFDKNLTPKMARELILELCAGQTEPKKDIVRKVDKAHVERGGKTAETKVHPVTNALNHLKGMALADNVDTGIWKIDTKADGEAIDDESDGESDDGVRQIGSGNNSVYVYYYPNYKQCAELQGKDTWPCKIGRSEYQNPIHRILEQAGTGFPEKPEIALVIQTNVPAELEKAMHRLLDRDRMSDAPGTEWFITNPNKVEEIYEIISQNYS